MFCVGDVPFKRMTKVGTGGCQTECSNGGTTAVMAYSRSKVKYVTSTELCHEH